MPGTSIGNYLVEVDGVGVCQAQECDTGGVKHEPYKIFTGDQPNPTLGRDKWECEEVKLKQAHLLNNEGAEFARIFQDYIRGIDLTKINIRIVTLDEDGITPVATDDYIECVPTMFQPETRKGEGKGPAHFTIGFKPTDHIPNY